MRTKQNLLVAAAVLAVVAGLNETPAAVGPAGVERLEVVPERVGQPRPRRRRPSSRRPQRARPADRNERADNEQGEESAGGRDRRGPRAAQTPLDTAQQTPDVLDALRSAAEQGDVVAQFDLGFVYLNGKGVPADDVEAAYWFRLAAEQGDAPAQGQLGVFYASGRGVLRDDAEALRWYRLAAEQGDARAQGLVGSMYLEGRGVLKDDAEAVGWFRLAAEQGDAPAQLILGLNYLAGRGVLKDETEAAHWLRLASAQGIALAQYELGRMYVLSAARGVLGDATTSSFDSWFDLGDRSLLDSEEFALAHMWLNIASANGHEEAGNRRDSLELGMSSDQIARATRLARTCMASNYQDCP